MNRYGQYLLFLAAGGLFGFGLIVAGMTNPAVIRGFLNLEGPWNPALLLTFTGALLVALPAFQLVLRKKLVEEIVLTDDKLRQKKVDGRLIVGAILFGVGWGIIGLCPGPAIVALGSLTLKPFLFFISLLVGAALARR